MSPRLMPSDGTPVFLRTQVCLRLRLSATALSKLSALRLETSRSPFPLHPTSMFLSLGSARHCCRSCIVFFGPAATSALLTAFIAVTRTLRTHTSLCSSAPRMCPRIVLSSPSTSQASAPPSTMFVPLTLSALPTSSVAAPLLRPPCPHPTCSCPRPLCPCSSCGFPCTLCPLLPVIPRLSRSLPCARLSCSDRVFAVNLPCCWGLGTMLYLMYTCIVFTMYCNVLNSILL